MSHEHRPALADDFADLGHAERSFSVRDGHFRDIAAGSELDLWSQLLSDPQILNDASDVDAGGSAAVWVGIDDGSSGKQRSAEIVDGRNAWSGGARGHQNSAPVAIGRHRE